MDDNAPPTQPDALAPSADTVGPASGPSAGGAFVFDPEDYPRNSSRAFRLRKRDGNLSSDDADWLHAWDSRPKKAVGRPPRSASASAAPSPEATPAPAARVVDYSAGLGRPPTPKNAPPPPPPTPGPSRCDNPNCSTCAYAPQTCTVTGAEIHPPMSMEGAMAHMGPLLLGTSVAVAMKTGAPVPPPTQDELLKISAAYRTMMHRRFGAASKYDDIGAFVGALGLYAGVRYWEAAKTADAQQSAAPVSAPPQNDAPKEAPKPTNGAGDVEMVAMPSEDASTAEALS